MIGDLVSVKDTFNSPEAAQNENSDIEAVKHTSGQDAIRHQADNAQAINDENDFVLDNEHCRV